MTADYVTQLALTGDAKSAPYSIDRLMGVVHPSIRGVLKAELDAAALKMKAENVTQAFYPVEYHLGDNRPVVVIKGTLKTWVGDKLTSNRDAMYRMTFSVEAGRIYMTEFVETSPHDPFNTTPTTPPTGATP
jgi:TraE protein.